jgi:hypothetical protein
MKIITNDLYCQSERWDDPGDYPNNCAGSALPSEMLCDFGGEFVFEAITPEELKELEDVEDWIDEWIVNECDVDSDCSISYKCEVDGNRCTVTITRAEYNEPEPDYPDRPEDYDYPDYDY